MSDDSFSEVHHVGWFERLTQSIGGVLVGIILFLVSFPLLFWNEGWAVRTAQSLAEGEKSCIAIDSANVDAANQGKVVHLSGEATAEGELSDPLFGVKVRALRLRRKAEIYQYKEEKEEKKEKKLGGGEKVTTTYRHPQVWTSAPIDSAQFHGNNPPQNRGKLLYNDEVWKASDVKLGAFHLSPAQVDQLKSDERLPVTKDIEAALPADLKSKIKAAPDNWLYQSYDGSSNPENPKVGDVRIAFQVLKPQTVSIVAQQTGDSFQPYHAKAGDTVDLIQPGVHSKEQMFQTAQESAKLRTWILRLVGFILMGLGITLVFRPFVVLADVIPIFGSLLGMGVAIFGFGTAFLLSLVTIAVAWIAYRPLIGIGLLLAAVLVALGLRSMSRKKHPVAAPYKS